MMNWYEFDVGGILDCMLDYLFVVVVLELVVIGIVLLEMGVDYVVGCLDIVLVGLLVVDDY